MDIKYSSTARLSGLKPDIDKEGTRTITAEVELHLEGMVPAAAIVGADIARLCFDSMAERESRQGSRYQSRYSAIKLSVVCSMHDLTMARPRPVPPSLRMRLLSTT